MAMVSQVECVHDMPLFCGGPVEGPLMALHDVSEFDVSKYESSENPLSENEVSEIDNPECRSGVAMSVQQESILKLVAQEGIRLRVFDGYSGWGPGQLEAELERGGWLIAEGNDQTIFSDPVDVWQQLINEIGRDIMTTGMNPRQIPNDPAFN